MFEVEKLNENADGFIGFGYEFVSCFVVDYKIQFYIIVDGGNGFVFRKYKTFKTNSEDDALRAIQNYGAETLNHWLLLNMQRKAEARQKIK